MQDGNGIKWNRNSSRFIGMEFYQGGMRFVELILFFSYS